MPEALGKCVPGNHDNVFGKVEVMLMASRYIYQRQYIIYRRINRYSILWTDIFLIEV